MPRYIVSVRSVNRDELVIVATDAEEAVAIVNTPGFSYDDAESYTHGEGTEFEVDDVEELIEP